MRLALLDTNVLLALAWPNHQHHGAAHQWFGRESRYGWATCAMTELGFVRLSSNPSYTSEAVAPQQAAALLARLLRHQKHRFWASPGAANEVFFRYALGHQQVNDAWLVEVARRKKGRVVTLDSRLLAHAADKETVFVIKP